MSDRERMAGRRSGRAWPVLFAAAACAVGCQRAQSESVETDSAARQRPVAVRAVRLVRGRLEPFLELVGVVAPVPERTATVSSKVEGWIDQVAVVEGQQVQAGEFLVALDPRLAEVELARAEAALSEKRAALARLERGYLPQEIAMVRSEAKRAEQEAASQQAQLEALRPLWQRGEAPEVAYRQAAAAAAAAQAAADGAAAKLRLYEAGTPQEEIAEAAAQVAAAEADVRAARLRLELCRIDAPIDGVVARLTARRGMFVDPTAPLLELIDLSRVFVRVQAPSNRIAQLRLGAPAEVRAAAYAETVFRGELARLAPEADPATGDLVAMIETLNREDHLLRPGMTAQVRLALPPLSAVLTAPTAAVADRSGVPVVTVVREGKAYEVEVQLGQRTPDRVEIKAGLQEGDWIVTEGGYGLPDGCPVRIVDAEAVADEPSDAGEPAAGERAER